MSMLDYLDEMDTFYLEVEDVVIDAACAPLADFTFTIYEMGDAEYIEPYALRGTLRTYRYTIREILISMAFFAGQLRRCRFIEMVFNCPLIEGWPETTSEVFKLNARTEEILAEMITDRAVISNTHNWQKEGF